MAGFPNWYYRETTQVLTDLLYYISDLGDGWAPTVLETREEFDFLRGAMGLFVPTYDQYTFVGGSTCIASTDEPIDYSDYETETSYGKTIYI